MSFFNSIINLISSLFTKENKTVILTGEQTKEQSAVTGKMAMTEANFAVMTARETEENKAWLREQMAIKDAVKTPQYTLTTSKAIYTITRPIKGSIDYTDQYGTQYNVVYKGK